MQEMTLVLGPIYRTSPVQSEEARRREAVRAQLDQITQDYKQAQQQARSALKQLK